MGYELNEVVHTQILQIPDGDWVSAVEQDGTPRTNGQVAKAAPRPLTLRAGPRARG